jgi:RNA polymerase sigma factor (TIGR02999 family)
LGKGSGKNTASAPGEITLWLARLREGDPVALDRLVPLLYDELRSLARRRMRSERAGHTLSTTALVHEAYLRLLDDRLIRAGDRNEFLAVAATVMRRLLIDAVRAKQRLKRGGGRRRVPLDEVEPWLSDGEAREALLLDEALGRLAELEPRAATVVELRFFAGMTLEEVGDHLGVSSKTAQRDWVTARAWLRKEIESGRGA